MRKRTLQKLGPGACRCGEDCVPVPAALQAVVDATPEKGDLADLVSAGGKARASRDSFDGR